MNDHQRATARSRVVFAVSITVAAMAALAIGIGAAEAIIAYQDRSERHWYETHHVSPTGRLTDDG